MNRFVERLFEGSEAKLDLVSGGFEPTAKYYHAMDFLLYVGEDCSYVADRVDPFLTVLYHPNRDNAIVGIKLKGFRFLFEQFKKVAGSLADSHFVPVVAFIEMATVAGVAEAIITNNRERIRASYDEARDLVKDVNVDSRELLPLVA